MKNEITVQPTTAVYEYELIDNGVLLTDHECHLRMAALCDDYGRGITNQQVEELLGKWIQTDIQQALESAGTEKVKINISIEPINE